MEERTLLRTVRLSKHDKEITKTGLEGNLKINGKTEQSHVGYCVSPGGTQSNQGALGEYQSVLILG